MDKDLEIVYEQIMGAVSAEDVFPLSDSAGDLSVVLDEEFERLHKITDPEAWSNPGDREAAFDANEKLKALYAKAKERIGAGTYGLGGLTQFSTRGLRSFETDKRKYFIGNQIAEGDLSTVFEGYCEVGDESAGEVIIKVINDPEDNDLAQNEIRILQTLHEVRARQWKHIPFLLDVFDTEGRTGIILRKFDGPTLAEVRKHRLYRDGVFKKHMVWMLNRSLSAIGFAHFLGIVHGNITPDHLIVRPKDHNLCIIDWSYAAFKPNQTGDSFKAFTEIYSPPEVSDERLPIPASDIYSLGKVMIWILGGNPKTNEMSDDVEEKLQRLLRYMVMESPLQRPQDAWKLHPQLIRVIEDLWGPRRFLPFEWD